MAQVILVVEEIEDWTPYAPSEQVVSASRYLSSDPRLVDSNISVINLCHSYEYLSIGYYCSLLAEARGQRVMPPVRALNDLYHDSHLLLSLKEPEAASSQSLKKSKKKNSEGKAPEKHNEKSGKDKNETESFTVFFGQTKQQKYQNIAQIIFEHYHAPILEVHYKVGQPWQITHVKAKTLDKLSETEEDQFAAALELHQNCLAAESEAADLSL